jgi:uncharacterized membrane-anchored protein
VSGVINSAVAMVFNVCMESCVVLRAREANVRIADINIAEHKFFFWITLHVTFTLGISDASPYSLRYLNL